MINSRLCSSSVLSTRDTPQRLDTTFAPHLLRIHLSWVAGLLLICSTPRSQLCFKASSGDYNTEEYNDDYIPPSQARVGI